MRMAHLRNMYQAMGLRYTLRIIGWRVKRVFSKDPQ